MKLHLHRKCPAPCTSHHLPCGCLARGRRNVWIGGSLGCPPQSAPQGTQDMPAPAAPRAGTVRACPTSSTCSTNPSMPPSARVRTSGSSTMIEDAAAETAEGAAAAVASPTVDERVLAALESLSDRMSALETSAARGRNASGAARGSSRAIHLDHHSSNLSHFP